MKKFKGEHCETTATGTLLLNLGYELSEPMIFGLGEGLGYCVMKFGKLNFPFIGGRIKTGLITKNICRNLKLSLDIKRTISKKKAWQNVKTFVDSGIPVGLQLDCYYLDYFTSKVHFAGHFIALTDYDTKYAYVVDTVQQGHEEKTTLENLAEARNSKQPMSEKNLSYTITSENEIVNLKDAIYAAIKRNAKDYLNPPIKNFGYKGILKTAKNLMKWYDASANIANDFSNSAMFMERAGTGGALFRNIYRDFLLECYNLTLDSKILEAHKIFIEVAKLWTEVANNFNMISETKTKQYVEKTSQILEEISRLEFKAMSILLTLSE